MNQAVQLGRATLADLLAIPEDRRRHEIIDGDLVEKEAASGRHGGAQVRLSQHLGPYDRRPGGRLPGGWWFATEVEIVLADAQVFRPDVVGWRRERLAELPVEAPISVVPDWVCEILSTNKRNDLVKKSAPTTSIASPTPGSSTRWRRRCRCSAGTPTATSRC